RPGNLPDRREAWQPLYRAAPGVDAVDTPRVPVGRHVPHQPATGAVRVFAGPDQRDTTGREQLVDPVTSGHLPVERVQCHYRVRPYIRMLATCTATSSATSRRSSSVRMDSSNPCPAMIASGKSGSP